MRTLIVDVGHMVRHDVVPAYRSSESRPATEHVEAMLPVLFSEVRGQRRRETLKQVLLQSAGWCQSLFVEYRIAWICDAVKGFELRKNGSTIAKG